MAEGEALQPAPPEHVPGIPLDFRSDDHAVVVQKLPPTGRPTPVRETWKGKNPATTPPDPRRTPTRTSRRTAATAAAKSKEKNGLESAGSPRRISSQRSRSEAPRTPANVVTSQERTAMLGNDTGVLSGADTGSPPWRASEATNDWRSGFRTCDLSRVNCTPAAALGRQLPPFSRSSTTSPVAWPAVCCQLLRSSASAALPSAPPSGGDALRRAARALRDLLFKLSVRSFRILLAHPHVPARPAAAGHARRQQPVPAGGTLLVGEVDENMLDAELRRVALARGRCR